jgi:ATP-dependent RNA helicase DDX46/PRP5
MRKAFRDKVKSGKSKDSSGFGGKGLERLDADREAARNRERKTHKTDGDDEDEKDEKDDDEIVLKAASNVQSASAPAPTPQLAGVPKGIDLDGAITVHKTETTSAAGTGANKIDKVTSAIEAINARLNKTGQLRSGVPIDNKGPDAGAFHATLEINDFPQRARWAVTNRTNVAKILEATGTSITTKGSFYPAGKEVPAGGDPKLYILVEGDTELVVTNAMRELMRHLKEGTIAAADAEGRAPTGRYTV